METLQRKLVFVAAILAPLLLILGIKSAQATDGHFLHGVGAINSAMGGASVATSEDSLGAIFNNPATMSDVGPSRFDFSFELFKPQRSVESTAGPLSGKTDSESSFTPIPAFGLVHRAPDSKFTHGIGILAIAGFGVDYPQDNSNPILAPQPNGFGHIFSNYQLLKISPSMAYAISPKISIGIALNLDWASLGIEPMPIAAPDCSGPATCFYPSASNQVGAFGAGFQIGFRYKLSETIKAGLAYTSPQWFEKFEWNSFHANPALPNFGQGERISFQLDVPQIVGVGGSWEPRPNLLIVADARWINYSDTRGFDKEGFNPDGSVSGFGWKNIWVFGIGTQFKPITWLALRLGYNYSQNPIPNHLSFFNVPAPAIVQHHLAGGIGVDLNPQVQLNVAYYHAFENSGNGPFQTPAGPAPGTSVKNSLSEDSALVEVSYRF
jgi:long-chain fatty acid transport protein